MKLSTISGLLIAAGTALLFYAVLIMDVSLGGRIVNLDMLNTRQNLVIVGAIVILVGTILLATSILAKGEVQKQPQQVDVPLQDRAEQALLGLEQLSEKGLTGLEQLLNRWLSKLDQLGIMKVISWGSFLAPPIGVLIIFKFWFGPKVETSAFDFFFGVALIASPFLLRKYRRK